MPADTTRPRRALVTGGSRGIGAAIVRCLARDGFDVVVNCRTNVDEAVELARRLVELVERQASCELYGLLKRPDEKLVTERAYDNPKFVEDMVRDVAARLNADTRIDAYSVESENFESIHNHSAYALIEWQRPNAG